MLKHPFKQTNRKGFTIVELVIVIAVIAILAAVLIPTFSGIVDKANESSAFQEATNQYKRDNINYMAQGYGSGVPDGKVYEVNGYYYIAEDKALRKLDIEEARKMQLANIKNIKKVIVIPE